MSNRKLIGRVSATEKYPSSCDDFQFWLSDDTILYSGSVVKTQIQSFYNELIYIVDKGEGYFPTRLHNQSTVLDSRRTLEFGC